DIHGDRLRKVDIGREQEAIDARVVVPEDEVGRPPGGLRVDDRDGPAGDGHRKRVEGDRVAAGREGRTVDEGVRIDRETHHHGVAWLYANHIPLDDVEFYRPCRHDQYRVGPCGRAG